MFYCNLFFHTHTLSDKAHCSAAKRSDFACEGKKKCLITVLEQRQTDEVTNIFEVVNSSCYFLKI